MNLPRTIVACLGVWSAGAVGRAGEPGASAQPPAPAPLVWVLTSPDWVGGVKSEVSGAPRLLTAAEGGPGLYFDGGHDGLWLPLNPLAGRAQFTIEILVRPEAGGPGEQRFFHVEDGQGNRALLELRMLDPGAWCLDTFLRAGEAKRTLIDRNRRHAAGRWTWVALVFDGHVMSHYVDGVRELAGEVAFGPMGEGRTSLGVRQDRRAWFRGAIREIRIHPVAVSPEKLLRAE